MCWGGCWQWLGGTSKHGQVVEEMHLCREDFEEIVTFLTSVPLFKTQLPRSELPKVAMKLKRKEWRPGQEIVKQGDVGKAFYLIMSGEAVVLTTSSDDPKPSTRAVLRKGDYFGGRSLVEERNNVATIKPTGKETCVTLSMSRKAFHDSGISQHLRFPKRAAIHNELPTASWKAEVVHQPKSSEEISFIAAAVRRNTNLRALLHMTEEQLSLLTASAERMEVKKNEEVALFGEVGDKFFIIREGTFEVVLGDGAAPHTSAEERVAFSSMAERLLRKQHFLATLSQPSLCSNYGPFGRTTSFLTDSRQEDLPSNFFSRHVSGPSEALRPTLTSPLLPRRNRTRGGGMTQSVTLGGGFGQIGRIQESEAGQESGEESADSTPPTSHDILVKGDSFGELALLYNMRREATFRAREASVVYAVPRRAWESCFTRRGQRFDEYCKLLDEVHALEPLLSSERFELACNASGFVRFSPGERVVIQGKVRRARQWYVIYAGTAVMKWDKPDGTTVELAEVQRPGCFGERSLLRGDAAYDVNVDAGPEGMTCLTFNGETIRVLLMRIYTESPGFIPDIHADIEEWCNLKARIHPHDSPCHSLDLSTGLSQIQTSTGSKKANLENLTKIQLLGRGAYGEVTLVQDTRQRHYALKAMSKGHLQRKGVVRQIRWERELLSMVDSPFVIRLHRTLQDEQHIFFIMEAALGGNLMELLHTHSEVFLEDRPRGSACAFYVACLIAALEHLHERCIVHRDIKPENVMLDAQGYAKLCDMGFARFVLNKTNTLAGTPEYMAPEVIEYPHTHDSSVDWWALGVLTYELLSGQTPFYDEGIAEPMARMLAIRRSQEEAFHDGIFFPFHFPSTARKFVQDLLQPCPETRCSGEHVRCHAMYRHFDFSFDALLARRLRSPFVPDVRIPEVDEDDPDTNSFSLEHDTELYKPFDRFKEESFV